MNIYLKYCGGCNPEIDRGRVVKKVEQLMVSRKIPFDYVSEMDKADVVLLVNGCPHACREEELNLTPGSFPMISVQGKRLRYKPVLEEDLPRVVFEKITISNRR